MARELRRHDGAVRRSEQFEAHPEQEKYFDEVIDKVDKRMKEATGSELAGIPRSAEEAEKQAEERQKEADRTAGRTSSDEDSSDSSQDK